jgi:hypothetical protein
VMAAGARRRVLDIDEEVISELVDQVGQVGLQRAVESNAGGGDGEVSGSAGGPEGPVAGLPVSQLDSRPAPVGERNGSHGSPERVIVGQEEADGW